MVLPGAPREPPNVSTVGSPPANRRQSREGRQKTRGLVTQDVSGPSFPVLALPLFRPRWDLFRLPAKAQR